MYVVVVLLEQSVHVRLLECVAACVDFVEIPVRDGMVGRWVVTNVSSHASLDIVFPQPPPPRIL